MRGIELKHIGVRSFMLKGLTARWGIDGDRPPMPPALRAALVAWYNTEIQKATNFDVIESYAEDFTANKWYNINVNAVFTKTAKSIRITNVLTTSSFLKTKAQTYGAEMVVKVSGLQPGVTVLNYRYGSNNDLVQITQNGIYTLPAGIPGAEVDGANGFRATTAFGECNITIEQLPTSKLTDLSGNGRHLHLYGYTGTPTNGINADGWLQSAGVGYGVLHNLPILTDYTVLAKRTWLGPVPTGAFISNLDRDLPGNNRGAFVFEQLTNSIQGTSSFGSTPYVNFVPEKLSWQTKNSYNGTPIAAGRNTSNHAVVVGAGVYSNSTGAASLRVNICYGSIVIANRTLTAEELEYVKQWMA